MKTLGQLVIAVCGNAFGLALMLKTDLGASAWGAATSNLSLFFGWSEGLSIIIISVGFYLIAILIQRRFIWFDALLSLAFLLAFGSLLDVFLRWLPALHDIAIGWRILWNVIGMLVLLFSIALHLHIKIAVHPLDVYMQALQQRFKQVAVGTYLTYGSAFVIAILFGLLHGEIADIGIGTILIVLFGGVIMNGYEKWVFRFGKEEGNVLD